MSTFQEKTYAQPQMKSGLMNKPTRFDAWVVPMIAAFAAVFGIATAAPIIAGTKRESRRLS
ncbi:MAG: hypothetical protein RLZZ450_6300 [Pseudomonadota bacterium]